MCSNLVKGDVQITTVVYLWFLTGMQLNFSVIFPTPVPSSPYKNKQKHVLICFNKTRVAT